LSQKLKVVYFVEPDAAMLAERAARQFVESTERAVAKRGRARIAVSGGSTPKAAFGLLADAARLWCGRMPWRRIELWWVDERCVAPDDAESNYRMTREALLDHVPLTPEQIHRMEGELEPETGAARYEAELRDEFRLEGAELPRFDVVALGMGPDGHTASLFPQTAALHETARLAVANFVPQKQSWRMTLTWPVINSAAEVFFLIGGADKAQTVKEVWLGPRDAERLPSQLIMPVGGILTLLLDRAAAAFLPETNTEGYSFIERDE